MIFDQVSVQTIIHYALEYFGKAWGHRHFAVIAYVTTALTLLNRAIFKSFGKIHFSV